MTSTTAEGSVEWFRRRKRTLLRDVRALDDLGATLRIAERLISGWSSDSDREPVRGALFVALVVTYCKPFVGSATGYRGEKASYSIKRLKQRPGFDAATHAELLTLRHKLLAHDDGDIFPPRMFTGSATIRSPSGGAAVTPPVHASLCSYSLHSVADSSAIGRLLPHLRACYDGVKARIDADLRQYLQVASQYADVHANSRETKTDGRDLMVVQAGPVAGRPNEPVPIADLAKMREQLFTAPDLAVRHGDYVYRMVTCSALLTSVKVEIDGQTLTFDLSEGPGAIAPAQGTSTGPGASSPNPEQS